MFLNLIFSHSGDQYSFRCNKFSDEYTEWATFEVAQYSVYIQEKIGVLTYLRDYMDQELESPFISLSNTNGSVKRNPFERRSSSGNNGDSDEDRSTDHSNRYSPHNFLRRGRKLSSQRSTLVHILDFRRFPDALFILLSDGTCQVIIYIASNLLILYQDKMIILFGLG